MRRKFTRTILIVFTLLGLSTLSSNATNFWTTITDPCTQTNALVVANNGNLIASGSIGCSYARYSTDNGATWHSSVSTGSSSGSKYIVKANGTIYGANSALLKSTDNGITWTHTTILTNSIADFAMNSSGTIFALSNGVLFKTFDEGVTWDTVNSTYSYPPAVSIGINSSNKIFIGTVWFGTGGKVYSSSDSGVSFTNMSGSIFSTTSVNTIHISNTNAIYVGTQGMGIYRSLDNGGTWTSINAGIPGSGNWINAIVTNNNGLLFVSGQMIGKVYSSSNQGNTWVNDSTGLQTSAPISMTISPAGYLYGGTNDFGTFRSTASYSGINEIEKINSLQIYPNPASSILNIHSQLSILNSQLIITDLLGNEVYKELLNGFDNTISLANWSNGIYFFEVRGQEGSTRGKFVVQK